MPKLKLITHKDEILEYEGERYEYQILSVKHWLTLVNFKKAFILISYPGGYLEIPVDHKFINNQSYKLMEDLNFENEYLTSWMYFSGSLEGNNKILSNIKLSNDNNNGLFGISYHCIIKNLTIRNCEINNKSINNAVLVGQASNAVLKNIIIEGSINIDGDYSGIVATNFNGVIDNLTINVSSRISSLFNQFNGEISNSYVSIDNLDPTTNPVICKFFKGKVNNCYMKTTNNDAIYKNKLEGYITNCYFDVDHFNAHVEKGTFYNCVIIMDDKKIIFNKEGEITEEFKSSEWDNEFWNKDSTLKIQTRD